MEGILIRYKDGAHCDHAVYHTPTLCNMQKNITMLYYSNPISEKINKSRDEE